MPGLIEITRQIALHLFRTIEKRVSTQTRGTSRSHVQVWKLHECSQEDAMSTDVLLFANL